ncbi:LacI family transcriptional regulator [Mesobacillus maritimus]|uniref:LacI family DNA-binding transcriptional regulator n=1 Tax=Mesobacillus maritimus TaxID=1643336 RepID=UPI00204070AC|nr:LacI family DNA-binding transcriptional regulator [Mesobacillus maritimus]MCM3586568.1 LacI family transcriptional regulator [Mesobacillus maritimus]MCM3668678.1 LacI family transcriptional regulator [Mesobacillus maritimus]
MLTIKEIAEMARVSRSTVSRVLNESGYVSEEARKRVLEVVERTGYVPSQHAQSLRTKKTRVIGVVLPKLGTETAGRVVNGINEILSEQGYQILLTSTNLQAEKEIEYLRLLKSRQVDGIILSATNINDNLLAEIKQLKLPFVAIGQDIPSVSSVTYDDFHAAKAMTELMIKKGRSKIAFIGVDEADQAVGVMRKQGFLQAMKQNGLQVRKEWMVTADFDIPSGSRAMAQILAETTEGNKPDAIFCVTERIAVGAMQTLKETGFKIPAQISITGIGASDISKYVDPALTTMDYENETAGKEAAKMLLAQIEKNILTHKKIVLNGRLIIRNSI